MSITWVRPEMKVSPDGVHLSALEVRTEPVVLLSTDCDLVNRKPPKRKGVLVSPLRPLPRDIARNTTLLETLRSASERPAGPDDRLPANLFYFRPVDPTEEDNQGVKEGVAYLEVMITLVFDLLISGRKLAEVTDAARTQLQERIKWHFTRREER